MGSTCRAHASETSSTCLSVMPSYSSLKAGRWPMVTHLAPGIRLRSRAKPFDAPARVVREPGRRAGLSKAASRCYFSKDESGQLEGTLRRRRLVGTRLQLLKPQDSIRADTMRTHAMSLPNSQANPIQKDRSEEHTSELQSQSNLVCRLLLE